MNILLTGDLHLTARERDRHRHDFIKRLGEIAKEHRVDAIALLGDLTHEKDYHPSWLVNKVVDHLDYLSHIAQVYVLLGNHDYTSLSAVPFFSFADYLEHVRWVGLPQWDSIAKRVLMLPHTPNYERDWSAFDDFSSVDWVLCHQTFEGAVGESGHKLSGIPLDVFPKRVQIVSGDIHLPQTVGTLTYVGAPYLCNFGDNYQPRVLLLNDKGLTSIPIEGPQKRLVEIASLAELDDANTAHVKRGDLVKVRVDINEGDYAQWQQTKDKIYAWGVRRGVEVCLVLPVVDKGVRMIKRAGRQAPKSDKEILKYYATLRSIDAELVRTGLELFETA